MLCSQTVWIHTAVLLPFSRRSLSLSTTVLSNLDKMTKHTGVAETDLGAVLCMGRAVLC